MNIKNEKRVAEKISAYIDDALDVNELESLLDVKETCQPRDGHFSVATRYHMVGDALRGELSDASMVDVSAKVSQALANETMDIPASVRPVEKLVLSENHFDIFAWFESFARPLTGMAVAVSVAMLMVVTVVQMDSVEDGQQVATIPAASTTMVANKQFANDDSVREQKMTEFDSYLVEHAEFAAQDTLQGRIPYVRAVSYEAE